MHEFEKFGISACKYKILDEKAKIFGRSKIQLCFVCCFSIPMILSI